MASITKILVALDFSAHSTIALAYAADLAHRYDAALTLLNVFDITVYSLADGTPMLGPRQFEELVADVEHRLEAAKRSAMAAGAARVEAKLLQGKPEFEILRVANQGGCDLIVMGTHGRTGLRHMLLGSVAERIVRHAPCPVFTVKAPLATDAAPAPAS